MRAIGGSIPQNPPDYTNTQMVYRQTAIYVPSIPTVNNKVFSYRGNSPYDPYPNVGGTGCYNWATYASQYFLYKCTSSKIKVRFRPMPQTGVVGATPREALWTDLPHVVVFPSTNSIQGTQTNFDLTDFRNQPGAVRIETNGESGQWKNIVRNKSSGNKLYGIAKTRSEDLFTAKTSGLSGLNPLYQWFWNIIVFSGIDDTVGTLGGLGNFALDVEITYYTKFYQRKIMTHPSALQVIDSLVEDFGLEDPDPAAPADEVLLGET